jgi:hypothetical protein
MRLGDEGNEREEIAHLRALEQITEIKHGHARGFEPKRHALKVAVDAAEYRLLAEGDTLCAVLFDRVRDAANFRLAVRGDVAVEGLRPRSALRFELHGLHATDTHMPGVGAEGIDDLLARVVVHLQRLALALWIVLLEIQRVLRRRTTEPVDRLPGVTDDPKALALARQLLDEQGARTVDVLVLVDKEMLILSPQLVAHLGMAPEQLDRPIDKVGEINPPFTPHLRIIVLKDPSHLLRLRDLKKRTLVSRRDLARHPGHGVGIVLRRFHLILCAADRAQDVAQVRQRLVKPQIVVEPEGKEVLLQEGKDIGLVEKPDRLRDPYELPVLA